MTYRNLMKKMSEGKLEVWSWADAENWDGTWTAEIVRYDREGRAKRSRVDVKGCPEDK